MYKYIIFILLIPFLFIEGCYEKKNENVITKPKLEQSFIRIITTDYTDSQKKEAVIVAPGLYITSETGFYIEFYPIEYVQKMKSTELTNLLGRFSNTSLREHISYLVLANKAVQPEMVLESGGGNPIAGAPSASEKIPINIVIENKENGSRYYLNGAQGDLSALIDIVSLRSDITEKKIVEKLVFDYPFNLTKGAIEISGELNIDEIYKSDRSGKEWEISISNVKNFSTEYEIKVANTIGKVNKLIVPKTELKLYISEDENPFRITAQKWLDKYSNLKEFKKYYRYIYEQMVTYNELDSREERERIYAVAGQGMNQMYLTTGLFDTKGNIIDINANINIFSENGEIDRESVEKKDGITSYKIVYKSGKKVNLDKIRAKITKVSDEYYGFMEKESSPLYIACIPEYNYWQSPPIEKMINLYLEKVEMVGDESNRIEITLNQSLSGDIYEINTNLLRLINTRKYIENGNIYIIDEDTGFKYYIKDWQISSEDSKKIILTLEYPLYKNKIGFLRNYTLFYVPGNLYFGYQNTGKKDDLSLFIININDYIGDISNENKGRVIKIKNIEKSSPIITTKSGITENITTIESINK